MLVPRRVLILVSALAAGCSAKPATEPLSNSIATVPSATTRPTFTNPLKREGADPWLSYVNGEYFLSTTTGDGVRLRHAAKFSDLASAKDEIVFAEHAAGRDRNFWAPEFHRLDDGTGQMRWYLYVTASGQEEPSHRMFVMESAQDDIRGPYSFKAKLQTDRDDRFYAIDGTVFEAGGEHYFVWCGRPSETGQGLFISRMENPWTLKGDRVALKADGFGCPVVREGPAMLRHGGKLFLVYSMCGASTPDYRLGMLIADEKSDLTNSASWKQHPSVVFARNDAVGVYGPGHNQFFKSPDGKEDWIVYHAKTTTQDTYADRATRAQPFTWSSDGLPVFGAPAPEGATLPSPSGE